MSKHMLYMGALHKETNKHINPSFATKEDKYICPDCKRSVIFRSGKIKRPHFAHKSEEIKCNYYDKPSESEIHKEAKFLMSHILNERIPITFKKLCESCYTSSFYPINYTPNSKAVNEQQKYDYMIKLRAPQIIRENLSDSHKTHVSTILNPSITRKQSKISIPVLYQKYGEEKEWSQNLYCTICGCKKYSPYYDNNNRKYYAICKICYDESNNITLDSPKRKYINKAPNNLYKCDFID